MRGTPDLGELGNIVKNDGQMDDTDDLDNEAQWKNATDLNSVSISIIYFYDAKL
jgi:hypothetical protein